MTLPGKMTLGFLQEDNPVKFYFRVRPLLLREDDGWKAVEGTEALFPDDGFIRIVPDKNEIGYFKTRMRAMGRYCLIDLRRHSGENDKIRSNKNHVGENGDSNAFIVYSDVITAVSPEIAAEVVTPDQDGLFPAPGTKWAAVCHDGQICGVYAWESRPEGACIVGENLAKGQLDGAVEAVARVAVDGKDVSLLTDLGRWGVGAAPDGDASSETDAPADETPAERPQSGAQAAVRPVQDAGETPEPREPRDRDEQRPAPEHRAARRPETVEPAEPESAAAAADDEAPASSGKARVQHTTVILPRVVTAKYATRKQALEGQTGYNPRRSTSIKDIVDDLWRQSRLDQLGHPVPAEAGSQPAVSPVDKALAAVREAWKLPEARASVISGILKLESLDTAMGANGEADAPTALRIDEQKKQLSRLESDRLRILCEIDELKKVRSDRRVELIEDFKRSRSEEIAQLDRRNKTLTEAQQRLRKEAEGARKAAEQASTAFEETLSEDLDRRLEKSLVDSRARDMMVAMSTTRMHRKPVQTEDMTPGELISAVRVRFEQAGLTLDNDECVNLLACLYLGRVVVISGATGTGKSDTARALAASLGIAEPDMGRFIEMMPEDGWPSIGMMVEQMLPSGLSVTRRPRLKSVLQSEDGQTLTVLMLDDANRIDVSKYLGPLLSQMDPGAQGILQTNAGSISVGANLRLLLTLRDAGSGCPVDGRLLDRAWLVRLKPSASDTPWHSDPCDMPRPEKAISMAAFRAAFDTQREIPAEITERVTQLRKRLAEVGVTLSRRTLCELRAYCAAVQEMMTASPMEILDRAIAQRAMPMIMAEANVEALHALPEIMPDMPQSLTLMTEPLPLPPL